MSEPVPSFERKHERGPAWVRLLGLGLTGRLADELGDPVRALAAADELAAGLVALRSALVRAVEAG